MFPASINEEISMHEGVEVSTMLLYCTPQPPLSTEGRSMAIQK
jgi:hypothetical protein